MNRHRRAAAELAAIALDAAIAALKAVDIEVGKARDDHAHVLVDDRTIDLVVESRAYCTGDVARSLARRLPRSGVVQMVVADKITAEARDILTAAGWSWLDLRGRLHLRGPAVRVDVDVPAAPGTSSSAGLPIRGPGGVSVAYWLCAHPGESLSPTRHAFLLGVAPSTISTAVRRLADAGLVDDDGSALVPELFWELASVWRSDRTWLAAVPSPRRHQPADRDEPRWRITGTAAAAAYGAPVVAARGGPVELYVPGPVALSAAVRQYGTAEPGLGAAVLGVAATAQVVRSLGRVPLVAGWPAAPPLAVALDLAQDKTRGREVLADWSHPDAVWR